VEEVIIRYYTTTGLEKIKRFDVNETCLNFDLRDIVSIDLLPLIWCTKLRELNIRHNCLQEIDLRPLNKCVNMESVRLSSNSMVSVDLEPLSDCPHLQELDLRHNPLRSIDLSPLFHCSELRTLDVDEGVSLTADLLLRSIGSWPDVLMDRFHKILWKSSED
jgi:hypothetical protein